LESGGRRRDVRTDADGNFAAELVAGRTIRATLHGRAHERELRIDHRVLPRRSLVVEADRPWARPGEVVDVKVADEEGGWPTESDVLLDTPRGRLVAPIGPGRPALFHVLLPDARNERVAFHASLAEPGSVTLASTEIFVGGAPPEGELDGGTGGSSAGSSSVEVFGPLPLSAQGELAVAPTSGSIAPGG